MQYAEIIRDKIEKLTEDKRGPERRVSKRGRIKEISSEVSDLKPTSMMSVGMILG